MKTSAGDAVAVKRVKRAISKTLTKDEGHHRESKADKKILGQRASVADLLLCRPFAGAVPANGFQYCCPTNGGFENHREFHTGPAGDAQHCD